MLSTNEFQVKKIVDVSTAAEVASVLASLSERLFCSRFYGMKTLGAASYLDIKNARTSRYYCSTGKDVAYYLDMAARYNPILLAHFKSIYSKLCRFFEKEFNVRCRLHSKAALPGFHVYENIEEFKTQERHVPHFDGQYEALLPLFGIERNKSNNILEKTLSYTLPISLPSDSCGLRVWDFDYRDTLREDKEAVKNKLLSIRPKVIEYSIGDLVYHSGNKLHQIKSWSCEEGKEESKRITLQGHGLLKNDCLYLYW